MGTPSKRSMIERMMGLRAELVLNAVLNHLYTGT